MDFSERPELAGLTARLSPIARQAGRLGIDWMLIGAAARDLIVGQTLGIPPSRRTEDVDVAIHVASWEAFEELKRALIEDEGGSSHAHIAHRLLLPDLGVIDLVPFGGVESAGKVSWPPAGDPVLDVLGFEEARGDCHRIALPGGLEIRVPRIEHYLCLKLIAWRDRHLRKPMHDAVDLADVLRSADRSFELEELYDEHSRIMEEQEFDPTRASLHILGARLARDLHAATRSALVALLRRETDEDGRLELVRELGIGIRGLEGLRALLRGIEGGD